MGLIASTVPIVPPNHAPTWPTTPAINTWQAGVGGTYDASVHANDSDGDALTFAWDATSTALPTGVTIASNGTLTATSSLAAGTTTNVRVTADDGTASPVASPNFSITVPSTSSKRWSPGHYLRTQGKHEQTDQVAYEDQVVAKIIDEGTDSPMKGSMVIMAWGAINTTGSTMSWSMLDNIMSILASQGQRLILQVSYKAFTSAGIGVLVPTDLISQADGNSRGWWGGVHRTATMTRFIACMDAIAARYDNNPTLEMVCTAESSPSFQGAQPGDYNVPDYVVELKRLYSAMATAFVKTNVMPMINSLSDSEIELAEYCYGLGIGIGGPDARDNVVMWPIWEGSETGSVRDYRGQLPHLLSASNSSLTNAGVPSLAGLIDICQTAETTHLAWIPGTNKVPNKTWADILVAIDNDPGLHTVCPTQYGSCEV